MSATNQFVISAAFLGLGMYGVLASEAQVSSGPTCKGSGVSYGAEDRPLMSGPPCLLCNQDPSCPNCNQFSSAQPGGGTALFCRCGTGEHEDQCCHAVILVDPENNKKATSRGTCRPALQNFDSGDCKLTYNIKIDPDGTAYAIQEYKCI